MAEAARVQELSHRLDAAGLPWPRSLAQYDAWLQAGEGDIDAAVQQCRLRVRQSGVGVGGQEAQWWQRAAPAPPACSGRHQPASMHCLPCHPPPSTACRRTAS